MIKALNSRPKGVLSGPLWVGGIGAIALGVAYARCGTVPAALTFLAIGGFALVAIGFLYLLFKNPDRLLSEEYQIAVIQATKNMPVDATTPPETATTRFP